MYIFFKKAFHVYLTKDSTTLIEFHNTESYCLKTISHFGPTPHLL